MKITIDRMKKLKTTLESLSDGEGFVFEKSQNSFLIIKTSIRERALFHKSDGPNRILCVELHSGIAQFFDALENVIPVDAEIIVKMNMEQPNEK